MGVPAGSTFLADNVIVAYLPDGLPAYAGYTNGPWSNMTALRARFPKALLIGVAVRLVGGTAVGARAVDAEPGTISYSQAGNFEGVASFLANYKGDAKPIVYTMASWATDLENYLASHGHARRTYILWSAHYTGLHLCGPRPGCGYSSGADGTQYATGHNDYSVFKPGVLGQHAGAPGTPGVLQLGDTGQPVKVIQSQLNKWAKAAGFGALLVDGDYGVKTYSAVRLFQAVRGQGLTVDGEVGPATARFLKNAPGIVTRVIKTVKPVKAPKPKVPSGTLMLRPGDVSKDVAAMQYYLRNSGIRGVRGIEADGDFGSETLTALKNFQKWAGFSGKYIDGVYGPGTAKMLAKVAVS